jgi:RHS repeat-associated protein
VDKPYGDIRYTYGTTPTNYRFTGQFQEASINLYIMGARWYDPSLGRWISADPVCPTSTDYSQFSLALTVSYAETSVLTQVNDANRQGGKSSNSAGLQVPGNPQLCNRFSYAANNPLGFTDPSGHDPIPLWRRVAAKACGTFAATLDTTALLLSGTGVLLEAAGFVGVPFTVGEEPLTFGGAVVIYNSSLNLAENELSLGSFFITAAGDFLSEASSIKANPFTVTIGQDTAVSLAGILTGNTPLTPEALSDSGVNLMVVGYDYGRLLELIPTGFEIQLLQITEDGVQMFELVPVMDESEE